MAQVLVLQSFESVSSNDRAYDLSEILYKMSTDKLSTKNTTYCLFPVVEVNIDGQKASGLLCNKTDSVTLKNTSISYLSRLIQVIFVDRSDVMATQQAQYLLTHKQDIEGNDLPLSYTMEQLAGLSESVKWHETEDYTE